MEPQEPQTQSCPRCGAPLPADAAGNVCPKCLMAGALEPPAVPADDPATLRRIREQVARAAPDLELGELLGRGGMGYVFRGEQKRLGRPVAVKVLLPELAEKPLFAERFEREARTLARLNHPNVVQVHDFGRAGPLCYLVLEFVEGTNLRQAIRSRSMKPAQALAVVREICDALEFAHRANVVHRDIKPENILLDRDGRVKIADFGLAKLLGEAPAGVALTSTGQVMGTLRYMAPEQLDRPLEVDHRADIYSLGVVFYEMLTGEIPMGSFPPPSQKIDIDVRVDEVVLKSMAKDPERRYQHASEVRTDVEGLGRPAPAGRAASTERRLCLLGPIGLLSMAIATVFYSLGALVLLERHMQVQEEAARADVLIAQGVMSASERIPDGHMKFVASMAGMGFIILVGLVVGSYLGWNGLARIRRDWPRWFGVGAAVTAAWLPVILVANAVLAALVLVPTDMAGHVPAFVPLVLVPALLAADVWFVVWYRARWLRRVTDTAA